VQKLANILCPKITKKVTETKTDENQDSPFIGATKKTFMLDAGWPVVAAWQLQR
jgi:hypothetical protein